MKESNNIFMDFQKILLMICSFEWVLCDMNINELQEREL